MSMEALSGQCALAWSRPTGAAPTAGGINPDHGRVELPAPCDHRRSIKRGTGLEDLSFTKRNGVKAFLRTTNIDTGHDRSRIMLAYHGQAEFNVSR